MRLQELQKACQGRSSCNSNNRVGILLEWLVGLQTPKARATSVEGSNPATCGSMKKQQIAPNKPSGSSHTPIHYGYIKNCCHYLKCHWEIKGRFRKRVVLANVPSFRFSFRGNICRNHPFGNHPFVNTKKGHWEIKGRFRKRVVLANVPSFRFSFRRNIRQNHPFGNHPFRFPRKCNNFRSTSNAFVMRPWPKAQP